MTRRGFYTVLACPRAHACAVAHRRQGPAPGRAADGARGARQEWGALVFESRRFVELRKQTFWTQFLSNESFGMGVFYTLNVFCIQAGPRLRAAILTYTCPAASGGGIAVSQLEEHLQLCGAALVGVVGRSGCACLMHVPRWVCWARAGSRMVENGSTCARAFERSRASACCGAFSQHRRPPAAWRLMWHPGPGGRWQAGSS